MKRGSLVRHALVFLVLAVPGAGQQDVRRGRYGFGNGVRELAPDCRCRNMEGEAGFNAFDEWKLSRENDGECMDLRGIDIARHLPVPRFGVFYGANLRGLKLPNEMDGAHLWCADLQGADLRGAVLYKADLERADLRCADLRGAWLDFARLAGADLRGADLRLHDPIPASIIDLRGAKYDGQTRLPFDEAEARSRGMAREEDFPCP